jgi:hypothetical protein
LEVAQRNSPYSYLKQISVFFSKKEQEGKTGLVCDLAPVEGQGYKERVWEVNVMEMLRTRV